MKVLIIVMIILVVLAFLFFLALAAYPTFPKRTSLEKGYEQESAKDFMEQEDCEFEDEYVITSYDGYTLHAALLPCEDETSKKYVIVSHGYTYNRFGAVKYAKYYRQLGYHCVVYDDRGHGANKRSRCMFGKREARDLMVVIEDTYRRYGQDIYLGLHGESMGSGLTLAALQYKPDVKFLVADCGYADVYDVMYGQMVKLFHLPKWCLDVANIFAKVFFGYSFTEIRPIDYVGDTEIPICFIHGGKDDFIHMSHSERMHKATKSYSEYHVFPEGVHGCSIDSDPDRYGRVLENFLCKVEAEHVE